MRCGRRRALIRRPLTNWRVRLKPSKLRRGFVVVQVLTNPHHAWPGSQADNHANVENCLRAGDIMTKVELPYVKRYRDRRGVWRHYFRRQKRLYGALPGQPGSPEF